MSETNKKSVFCPICKAKVGEVLEFDDRKNHGLEGYRLNDKGGD